MSLSLNSPTAATGSPAREQALEEALQHQIISQKEHDNQLRQLRGDTGRLVAAPTRAHGGKLVAKHRGLWIPVAGPFYSKEAAVQGKDVVGRWKSNRQGDKKLYRCDAHINCPVLLRVCNPLGEVGGFYLEVLDLAHSLEDNLYANKQTKFTIEQAKSVEARVECGKKPRQMWAQDVLAVLKKDPKKKLPGGGAEGMHHQPPTHPARARHDLISHRIS